MSNILSDSQGFRPGVGRQPPLTKVTAHPSILSQTIPVVDEVSISVQKSLRVLDYGHTLKILKK